MQQCVSKEKINCIFLTKETRDEFLKEVEPNLSISLEDGTAIIKKDNDREIVIDFLGLYKAHYLYNRWYVQDYIDYFKYNCYTKSEFEKLYSVVE